MQSRKGDAKQVRNEALAGIAVMNEDLERAEDLLAGINAGGELLTFEGNRFKTFAAIDDQSLDGLSEFQEACETNKVRYCLALSVPVSELQTEPASIDGNVVRTFCSTNGLPVRTQQEQEDGSEKSGYRYCFKRPSFWLVRLVVDSTGGVTFYSTLMGQYRNADGNLVYRPVTRKSFDTESNSEVEKPITKKVNDEESASRELNINSGFLFAMCKPCLQLADSARRRSGLRASVNRASVTPLTSTLGETFPGLEAFKAKLEAQEAEAPAPAKAKKAKKAKPEAVAAE